VLRRHQQVLGDEHGNGRAQDRPDRAGHRGRLEVRGHQQLDPFIPANEGPGKYGMEGVLRGAAMVFFAYIGFEAVSVAAQESKNPQRDMPIGMMLSLVICTVLYIAMAAVMTGLVPFQLLGTDEPVVTAVAAHPQLGWLRWVVEVGALVGLSSVVLVMIIGQPRIFMIMGRDGLLPPVFTRIHPKYRTRTSTP
jgi:APA family basic amino acid/polyamine antiporter